MAGFSRRRCCSSALLPVGALARWPSFSLAFLLACNGAVEELEVVLVGVARAVEKEQQELFQHVVDRVVGEVEVVHEQVVARDHLKDNVRALGEGRFLVARDHDG